MAGRNKHIAELREVLNAGLRSDRSDPQEILFDLVGRSPIVDAHIADSMGRLWRGDSVDARVAPYRPPRAIDIRRGLGKARRAFRTFPGVRSVHWGIRERHGQLQGRPSIVVVVKQKKLANRVPESELLPSFFLLQVGDRCRKIYVDVQSARGLGRLHGGGRIANYVKLQAKRSGLVAAVVSRNGEPHALTAGHLAPVGTPATAKSIVGTTYDIGEAHASVFGLSGDAASIGPIPLEAVEYLALGRRQFRNPVVGDVGRYFFIRLPREALPIKVLVSSVGVRVPFRTGGASVEVDGLCGVSRITKRGDSGAPVTDRDGVVVGIVVGAWKNESFIMPAGRAANAV